MKAEPGPKPEAAPEAGAADVRAAEDATVSKQRSERLGVALDYVLGSFAVEARTAIAKRVSAQEAVFTKILGDPPKLMEECSDEELAELAEETGVRSKQSGTDYRVCVVQVGISKL